MKDEPLPTIESLKAAIAAYYPDADLAKVQRAHDLAVSLHEGQVRKSGEPYIIHPLQVAMILARMRMDIATIVTGLLHDTVEDTATTVQDVQEAFGPEVAQLVDGVTKISAISFKSSHEKQAENFRKMILAMAKDLRVIIVKLADRTHNMRTLEYMTPKKQVEIAQETIEIYAPLANRLGISWLKMELEDLCLRYLHPEVYYKLARLVAKKKTERDQYIDKLIKILTDKLAEYGVKVKISGRAKHFYSIYKKMDTRGMSFEEVHDLVAFRIVTNTVAECYEALGIVHSFFKPVPGRFKDYIAMPKNNMYQSLHTTVIGPFGERLEIQIRTEDMHRIAEAGIAAHWEYKEGKLSQKDLSKFQWLRQLVEAQETLDNPTEFLESVKLDLFAGDIYVFTPKGEIRELPVGATPLDFAYSIHTDVGHRCTGAKVNGRMVSLKHKLRSGDTIEIVTSATQKPSKDWLKIVKTGRARSKISQVIRSEERVRARDLGYEMLDKEFRRYGQSLSKFEKQKDVPALMSQLSFAGIEEMFISVGYGKAHPDKILDKLFPDKKPVETSPATPPTQLSFLSNILTKAKQQFNSSERKHYVKIEGIDDILVRFGRCCNPLPGDEIVGFISRGRGVTVHKLGCPRTVNLDQNRSVEVSWSSGGPRMTRDVKIKVLCQDEPGLLNDMARVISTQGVNIKSLNIRVGEDKKAVGTFDLEVKNKEQLASCIKELEGLAGIISVKRL
ncbi:MAG: bifunctional (p)ppGpp synthetase/guanosine-3',5'-bis(diphosphate) 3'-pyrophosphohydrolase [Bdellovibrionales bacterium]|nr:bifunctional (p)ppGpp synthetase/guanosine-3',5'-bis(diphosphate) 3'-pyrophosphohydrolase [Bdellovibrionales bacterium]